MFSVTLQFHNPTIHCWKLTSLQNVLCNPAIPQSWPVIVENWHCYQKFSVTLQFHNPTSHCWELTFCIWLYHYVHSLLTLSCINFVCNCIAMPIHCLNCPVFILYSTGSPCHSLLKLSCINFVSNCIVTSTHCSHCPVLILYLTVS